MSDSINQGLAANVLRLGNECRDLGISNAVLRDENARLKSLCDNLGMGGKHTITAIDAENASLKAQVERLTKAGDKMAHIHRFLGFPSYTSEWESAKEGKQP